MSSTSTGPIVVYNSQSRRKEPFVTLEPGRVKMYVCGPTVWDFLHVGNFRGAIFFNVVRNWLEKSGYKVTYVYNFTDVDDKIIQRAQKDGVPSSEISERYIEEFKKDFQKLGLTAHSHNPKVTEFMKPIIHFISDLIAKGKAYEMEGDVYYDVHAFPEYGKLSNKNIEELEAGFRIDVDQRKRNPSDFALWKKSKEGEPYWDSPWSKGRPGWHIECSAMIRSLLGEQIDIHGGGLDLIFPHHENEVAQSEGVTGRPFVKYWMHNNMIQFGAQKMSKSLGNVRTGRAFLDEYNGEILKFMMLSAHYRSPSDFSEGQIEKAISGLARVYSALAYAERLAHESSPTALKKEFQDVLNASDQAFQDALNDDFNTPGALAQIYEAVRAFNHQVRTGSVAPEKRTMAKAFLVWMSDKASVLSLFQEPPQEFLRSLDDRILQRKGLKRSEIDQLVTERSDARKSKNFALADEIRTRLSHMGIQVHDLSGETLWEVDK